jgi:hypothetical protein
MFLGGSRYSQMDGKNVQVAQESQLDGFYGQQ